MPHTEVPGERVPLRMWAAPDEVEAAAMEQLRNVTRMPWVHGLAVMPDVRFREAARRSSTGPTTATATRWSAGSTG